MGPAHACMGACGHACMLACMRACRRSLGSTPWRHAAATECHALLIPLPPCPPALHPSARYCKPRNSYKSRSETGARHNAFSRGSAYLERYCVLIALAGYFEECGLFSATTFRQWLANRCAGAAAARALPHPLPCPACCLAPPCPAVGAPSWPPAHLHLRAGPPHPSPPTARPLALARPARPELRLALQSIHTNPAAALAAVPIAGPPVVYRPVSPGGVQVTEEEQQVGPQGRGGDLVGLGAGMWHLAASPKGRAGHRGGAAGGGRGEVGAGCWGGATGADVWHLAASLRGPACHVMGGSRCVDVCLGLGR